jgi:hypothetical protein
MHIYKLPLSSWAGAGVFPAAFVVVVREPGRKDGGKKGGVSICGNRPAPQGPKMAKNGLDESNKG